MLNKHIKKFNFNAHILDIETLAAENKRKAERQSEENNMVENNNREEEMYADPF